MNGAGYKNIAAPWEITRVEIPGRAKCMDNENADKIVLDTGLYCIRREMQLSDINGGGGGGLC